MRFTKRERSTRLAASHLRIAPLDSPSPRHRADREVDAPSLARVWLYGLHAPGERADQVREVIESGKVHIAVDPADLVAGGPVYVFNGHGELLGELSDPIPTPKPPALDGFRISTALPPFLEETMRRQNPDHPRSN